MDEDLVVRAKKGHKKAFAQLVEFVKRDGYRVAYSYLHNEADSKDALCNAIEKAYVNLKDLKDNGMFKHWFLRIVINECKMIIRKNHQAEIIPLESLLNQEIMAPVREHSEEKLDIERALSQLEESERTMILMKYYMEYTFREISEILGIPESTVKTKTYAGLRILEEALSVKEGYHVGK